MASVPEEQNISASLEIADQLSFDNKERTVRAYPSGKYQAGPVAEGPHHPGVAQGVSSLVCAALALVMAPLFFGTLGVILGLWGYYGKREKFAGAMAALSLLCMILGLLFEFYIYGHPSLSDSPLPAAVVRFLSQ